MTTFETTRHQVAIAGQVSDFETTRSIAGALVRITAAPAEFLTQLAALAQQYGAEWATLRERPDQTATAPDGHFHFLDLPNGQYTLAVSLPGSGTRYGTRQGQVSVSRDASDNIVLAAADLTLPPTVLKGQVTRADGTPLAMAAVRIKGSGEQGFSDGQGRYVLAPLEIGQRTIIASAQGFSPVTRVLQLATAGTAVTANFTLAALAP